MSPKPSDNGVEGDDERDSEEEEDEPRLKYQRMGGSVTSLLSGDAASCIAVAERMIALGTHGGSVHILDFLGNQVIQQLRNGAGRLQELTKGVNEAESSPGYDGDFLAAQEKFMQKELLKVGLDPKYSNFIDLLTSQHKAERMKQKEELRREKEAARQKVAIERAALRRMVG